MTDEGIVKKICPKCGASFECYRTSKKACWCENFKISPKNLKVLAEKYSSCLCPDCLALFGEKKE
ncbi:hypothetical protein DMA11_03940 [Marinilabiliaceae bacterium JC017]|nr:hypothetical protein DMA11_03940 [Marinilabiliaceae bacterium JC017]